MACRWYRWIFIFIAFIMNLHIYIVKTKVKRRIVVWKYLYWSKMFVRSRFLLIKIGFKSRHDRISKWYGSLQYLALDEVFLSVYVRLKWRKSKATELTKNKLYLSCSFSFFFLASSSLVLVLIYYYEENMTKQVHFMSTKEEEEKRIDEIYLSIFFFNQEEKITDNNRSYYLIIQRLPI